MTCAGSLTPALLFPPPETNACLDSHAHRRRVVLCRVTIFRGDVILHAAFIAGAWIYLQQIHIHLTLPKLIV